MATKGDITDLDELIFGGNTLVPLVSGFNRYRRSGVVQSDVSGGTVRQRKKYFNMPHIADVSFYLDSPGMQYYIQSFINKNEGKKFICHLSADRPIVEPYVCQAISDWQHNEVNALKSTVTCQFEIFSTSEPCLDDFIATSYSCMGDDMYCVIKGMGEIVERMPV